jgi:hypothetical protein
MTLNASGVISIGGATAGQSINLELGLSATANSSLNDTLLRALASVPSGIISLSNFYGKSSGFKQGIFGFGSGNFPPSFMSNITNIVSSSGVVASDVSGVGNVKRGVQAATFGGDKGIFGFGLIYVGSTTSDNSQNIVSNTGVLASATFATGNSRYDGAGAGYGNDKGLYAFGADFATGRVNTCNLITNTGVVASDTAGAGTARDNLAAATYGYDKAIFGFGFATSPSGRTAVTNLVSNTGVIATDTAGVGTARTVGAATFGVDRAIFGFGNASSGVTAITNLVSNTGVVATDTAGVGTARVAAGCGYGGPNAMFAFGGISATAITNLVSSTGVVASDTSSVATNRSPAGTSFGQ